MIFNKKYSLVCCAGLIKLINLASLQPDQSGTPHKREGINAYVAMNFFNMPQE